MDEVIFLFEGWRPLLRVIVVGVAGYVGLIVLLRATGTRTLLSMNAFDFVVTVALGAVFGRALTAESVSLAEVLTAAALLILLQYAVSWIKVRSTRFAHLITGGPVLLAYRGRYLPDAMRRARVSAEEVRTAIRQRRLGSIEDAEAVVLETSGTLSVVPRANAGNGSALPPPPPPDDDGG